MENDLKLIETIMEMLNGIYENAQNIVMPATESNIARMYDILKKTKTIYKTMEDIKRCTEEKDNGESRVSEA